MSHTNLISFSKSSYTPIINELEDRALAQLSNSAFKVFHAAYRSIFGFGRKIWGWLSNTKIEEKANLSPNTIRRGLLEAQEKGFIKIYHEKIYGTTRQYIVFICEENKDLIDDLDNKKATFTALENDKIAYLTSVKLAKSLDTNAQKLNPKNSKIEGSTFKNCVRVPSKIEPIKHTTNKTNILNNNNQTQEENNDDDFLQKSLIELKEKLDNFIHPVEGKFTKLNFKVIENMILHESYDPKLKLKAYYEQLEYLPYRKVRTDLENCYFGSVNGNWSIPKNYKNTEAEEEKNIQLEKDTEKFTPIIKIWDTNHSGLISEKNAYQTMLSKIKMKLDDFNYSKDNLERLDIALDLIEKITKTKNLFGIDLVEKSSKKKELELIFDRYSELLAA